jgi:hypothetical protein
MKFVNNSRGLVVYSLLFDCFVFKVLGSLFITKVFQNKMF